VSIIIICGEDDFLIEKASLEEIRSLLVDKQIQCSYFEYEEFKDLESVLDQPVCYVVKNCEQIELPSINKEGVSYIFLVKPGVDISEKIKVDRRLYIRKFKVSDSKNEVMSWILNEGERLNIDLSRVAGALFVNCGNRPRKIYSEILKLKTLVGTGQVTPEQAKRVLSFSAELNPKIIIDAISNGKTSLALSYYDRLQEKGDETGWILSFLHNFVLQLLKVKYMRSIGKANAQESLSLNPYIYNNHILPHLDKWSLESLKTSASVLADLDLINKKGGILSDFLLESEIIRLSEEVTKRSQC
jgi:DNA polymerase III delta subunit